MTSYTSRTLADAIMGEEKVAELNAKVATKELRKFLRTDHIARGAADELPGKGGRYSIELKAAELRAMRKRFEDWATAQADEKAQRKALNEALKAPKAAAPAEEVAEALEEDDAPADGPSDDEIAAMLNDADDETLDI